MRPLEEFPFLIGKVLTYTQQPIPGWLSCFHSLQVRYLLERLRDAGCVVDEMFPFLIGKVLTNDAEKIIYKLIDLFPFLIGKVLTVCVDPKPGDLSNRFHSLQVRYLRFNSFSLADNKAMSEFPFLIGKVLTKAEDPKEGI